jgi:hypothetical protein
MLDPRAQRVNCPALMAISCVLLIFTTTLNFLLDALKDQLKTAVRRSVAMTDVNSSKVVFGVTS